MIKDKRNSLESFIKEQLIGPGGCGNNFGVYVFLMKMRKNLYVKYLIQRQALFIVQAFFSHEKIISHYLCLI